MENELYDEMYRLESTHWWFVAKRRIILSMVRKCLPTFSGGSGARVCDVGCGCGMMLHELKEAGYDAVGLDVSDTAIAYCAARGVRAVKGSLPDRLGLPAGSADAVLMLDVLEHMDDDQAALRAGLELLSPDGWLIATVPAYPWLWTRRDEFHHHKRRYSKNGWRQMLEVVADSSDAAVMKVSYFNTYLFPLAAAGRLAAKVLPQPEKPGDMSIPPLGINRVLAGIFGAERAAVLHNRISLPFGLSLLAVLHRHPSSD